MIKTKTKIGANNSGRSLYIPLKKETLISLAYNGIVLEKGDVVELEVLKGGTIQIRKVEENEN